MELLNYEESQIDKRILRAVKEMGFEQMTPIQEQAIPLLLEGHDIIGQAQTGTGKTAAFGIPVIQNIDPENTNAQCIILCPTRELAVQAAEEIRKLSKFVEGVKVLPIYGGQEITKQIRSLKSKVSIIVGTPGRVMDHMRRHTLKLDDIKMVVLDEADEMLNMGFKEDIETILAEIPQEHQTALFSATMPKPILDITKNYQKDAVMIKLLQKELTIPLVKQYYYEVSNKNKEAAVARLLDYYNPKQSLIFCNTKKMVDELTEKLKGRGYFAEGIHGDMSQNQRDKVMSGYRNGVIEILIATDVAARGIDVDDIEAVFNYDIPQDIEYYVHRIGRTGRAGRKGRSFTLVVGREIFKIREIEQVCKTKVTARTIPSAADITAAKAEKTLKKVFDVMHENDLEAVTRIIEQKLNDEDCTAIELAAAFLKLHMGETLEDIPTESYKDERNTRRRTVNARRSQANKPDRWHIKRDITEKFDNSGEQKKYSDKPDKKSEKSNLSNRPDKKNRGSKFLDSIYEKEKSLEKPNKHRDKSAFSDFDMLIQKEIIEEESFSRKGKKKTSKNESFENEGYILWDKGNREAGKEHKKANSAKNRTSKEAMKKEDASKDRTKQGRTSKDAMVKDRNPKSKSSKSNKKSNAKTREE